MIELIHIRFYRETPHGHFQIFAQRWLCRFAFGRAAVTRLQCVGKNSMRPLVAVRTKTPFCARFCDREPLFWPLARAARALGEHADFPPVDALARVFAGTPPVKFVQACPRRGRRAPLDARALYDARITLDRTVPTRERSWHDLMNALVWGTFPGAKLALHARQHRGITERLTPGTCSLPPTRTRELDALALLDEGGVVVLAQDPQAMREALTTRRAGVLRAHIAAATAEAVVFGHAIYESLALGVAPAVVAALVLPRDAGEADLAINADRALATAIQDEGVLRSPDELTRVDLREASF
jgi:hypothetical protein